MANTLKDEQVGSNWITVVILIIFGCFFLFWGTVAFNYQKDKFDQEVEQAYVTEILQSLHETGEFRIKLQLGDENYTEYREIILVPKGQ